MKMHAVDIIASIVHKKTPVGTLGGEQTCLTSQQLP